MKETSEALPVSVEKVEPFKFAELPSVDELDQRARARAVALLKALETAMREESEVKERVEDLKSSLTELQKASGLAGLRFERLCFIARDMPGSRVLDRVKLIENGVKPSVIEDSMRQGKPYVERRFKLLETRE